MTAKLGGSDAACMLSMKCHPGLEPGFPKVAVKKLEYWSWKLFLQMGIAGHACYALIIGMVFAGDDKKGELRIDINPSSGLSLKNVNFTHEPTN